MVDSKDDAAELRRSRLIRVQMIVVGIVLSAFGLLAFFLSSAASGTYQGKWRYVSTLGLALVGFIFLCLGLARKLRNSSR